MTTIPPPSKDPANDSTLGGAMREVFRKLLQGTDGMLPAVVVSYDRESNTAEVRPTIALLTTSGEVVPRAAVARVPVLALGGGGFVLNFPLQPGDRGWIEASDRDISLWMQGLAPDQRPNTLRLHSFEDGRFVPDVFREFDVSDVGADAMTIQSLDGTVRVELSPSRLRLVAPTIKMDATAVEITADSVDITGDVATTGTLTNNGVNVGSPHTHGGVQTGGGTSGPPTP